MKRIFIIHGWEGTPNSNWFPWLKKELEKRGIEVHVPQLPDSMNPKFDSWISYVKEYVENPDRNTILVGHSLGCITILRFLENLNTKVKAVVLVAGLGYDLDYKGYKGEVKSFFEKPIDWEKIKNNCQNFIVINSKDDPYVNFDNSKLFKDKLNAEIIVHDNMKHYNEGAGFRELPQVLDLILKL